MKSRLFATAAAACTALFVSCHPGLALETVTLPQGADGYTPFQDPDSQAQNHLSTDKQGDTTTNGLGSFHFSMSSGAGWPNDPGGYYYRPGASSSAGYGSATVPGSEFYNNGYSFPH